MATTVKIKRSVTTATPATLAEGEVAYSENSDNLFIGTSGANITVIGGAGTFAKKASPAFTGTPTAPTASNGTNTTQIATTAFVQNAVSTAGGGDMLKSVYDPDNDGKIDYAQLEGVGTAAALNVAAAGNAAAGEVVKGNDTRLTDARTPTTHSHAISEVTNLQTSLDAKAPLASPALTGTPTAPTATAGTNTTQIATTAFVGAAVSSLINGAPGALDTLNELAASLGNDANFATTVTNGLAGKLAISSNLSDLNNVATARTNLGLGTIATQNANAVNITGGTIDGVTIDGGSF